MKKVTLLIPDTIQLVIASDFGPVFFSEDVTPKNIRQALCDRNGHHKYYWFESSDEVNIISIADYEGSTEKKND